MSSKAHHEAEPDQSVEWNKEKTKATIRPRGFNIVWGKDPRYWHLPHKEKQKDEAAELAQVSWLEVTCSVEVDKGKQYEIGFNVSLKPNAFGWGDPVYVMAKVGKKGKYSSRQMKLLDLLEKNSNDPTPIPKDKLPITVPGEGGKDQLFFGLYEVWSGKWKGGLLIHNAFIKQVTEK